MNKYQNYIGLNELVNELRTSKTSFFQALVEVDISLWPKFFIEKRFAQSLENEAVGGSNSNKALSEVEANEAHELTNLLRVESWAIERATRTEGWQFRSDIELATPRIDENTFNSLKDWTPEKQAQTDNELSQNLVIPFKSLKGSEDYVPCYGASLHDLFIETKNVDSLKDLLRSMTEEDYCSSSQQELKVDGVKYLLTNAQVFVILSLKLLEEKYQDKYYSKREIEDFYQIVGEEFDLSKIPAKGKGITDIFKKVKTLNGDATGSFIGKDSSSVVIRFGDSPRSYKYKINKKFKIVP